MLSTRDPFKTQGHIQTESSGLGKYISCKWIQKKAGEVKLISAKIDFETKTMTRDKERYYVMIKRSIQEEDIAIINMYASKKVAPQYIGQTLTDLKGEIDSNTMIV